MTEREKTCNLTRRSEIIEVLKMIAVMMRFTKNLASWLTVTTFILSDSELKCVKYLESLQVYTSFFTQKLAETLRFDLQLRQGCFETVKP